MSRYIVRVWIEDIEVEADSKDGAEVQQQQVNGKWVYVPSE